MSGKGLLYHPGGVKDFLYFSFLRTAPREEKKKKQKKTTVNVLQICKSNFPPIGLLLSFPTKLVIFGELIS